MNPAWRTQPDEWDERSARWDAQADDWDGQPGPWGARPGGGPYPPDQDPDDQGTGHPYPDPASMSTQPLPPGHAAPTPATASAPAPPYPPIPSQPVSGHPGAGHPVPAQPVSADPVSGHPVSGQPTSGHPVSGDPYAGPSDPLFPDDRASWQPRIVPSPPPQRGRVVGALLVGLLAGLLVFGSGGFFVGRWTAGGSTAEPTAGPAGEPTLAPYERSQVTLNGAAFTGDLAAFAEPWLPWVSGCAKSGDTGGPKLGTNEVTRVHCKYGAMSLYFVEYSSVAERDKIRYRNLGQNLDARELTPGATTGTERRETPSGRTEGGYVEYAYRTGTGDTAPTVAGLWWDDADRPVGAYLLAYWTQGVGESWAPMRDIWARYA